MIRRFPPRSFGKQDVLVLFALPSALGCSLVVDSDRPQCESTFECRERGTSFATSLCIEGLCQADPQWACVESFELPPAQEATQATLEVFDIYEQSRPLAGVHASLHTLLDFNLANPISEGDTDADGKVTLSVPEAFSGFVHISAEGVVEPALFYPDLPLPPGAPLGRALIGAPGTDDAFLGVLGETPQAGRGGLFLQARDCTGAGAAGASLRFDNNMAGSRIYYVSAGLPSVLATAFDGSGVGGVANANPGTFNINLVAGGETVSSKSVLVLPDTLTVTTLLPGSIVLTPAQ